MLYILDVIYTNICKYNEIFNMYTNIYINWWCGLVTVDKNNNNNASF